MPRDGELGDKWYNRAADGGSIEAARLLAFGYYRSCNYDKAVDTFEGLCRRVFTPAMYCLGSFYFIGTGVNKDIDEALSYWGRAESGGHLVAKRRISIILRIGGEGVIPYLKGISKMVCLIYPYIKYNLTNPRSDRLQDW